MFKKYDRVKWLGEDKTEKFGTVRKGGKGTIIAVADGGGYEAKGPAFAFTKCDSPLPAIEPSLMDKYSIKGKKGFQGSDGECFTASIYVDGKFVGTVRNDGNGGPNMYYGKSAYGIPDLEEDAKKWAKQFGYETPFEAADLFVEWYCEHRPYGIGPREYLKGFTKVEA